MGFRLYTTAYRKRLKVRLEFRMDTFMYASLIKHYMLLVCHSIDCVILAGLMWFMVGRDETVVENC